MKPYRNGFCLDCAACCTMYALGDFGFKRVGNFGDDSYRVYFPNATYGRHQTPRVQEIPGKEQHAILEVPSHRF
eukprot:4688665-Amphidinium_carterae.1